MLARARTRARTLIRRLTSQGRVCDRVCHDAMRDRASEHEVWIAVMEAGTVQLGGGGSAVTARRRVLVAVTGRVRAGIE